MKLKSVLLAAMLAALASSTTAVFAADEHHADAKAEKADAAKTGGGETAKPAKKKNSHSHPVDKGVMPPSAEPSGTKNEGTAPKKPTHDHKQMKGG